MLTVNELFSGIGAFRKALINCGIEHQIVGISEVDKYAIASYEAIYGPTRNYGDISKVVKLDYADMWTYGFPCQDISLAGHKRGIVKGETRSGLLYEVQRLLEISISCGEAPKFLIMENVKNLVGARFKPDFDRWISWLNENGYVTHWKVLKASDYGIPQRRERVIAISIRQDIYMAPMFQFPQPRPLKARFRDLLEDDVDEKYFLSGKHLTAYEEWQKNNNKRQEPYGFKFAPTDRGGAEIAKTLRTRADDRCSNYIVEQLPDCEDDRGR